MRKNIYITLATILVVIGATATVHLKAQQQDPKKPQATCPMMKTHTHNMAEMNKRGDQGMGFSQEKTTHHFYLTKTGGIIQVDAIDPKDTASRDKIREHLTHIAMMFAEGNFDTPMFVHDRTPAGVADMQRLKTAITYKYKDTELGGRVLITSADQRAITAVQSFLRFQIREHETGDTLEVVR